MRKSNLETSGRCVRFPGPLGVSPSICRFIKDTVSAILRSLDRTNIQTVSMYSIPSNLSSGSIQETIQGRDSAVLSASQDRYSATVLGGIPRRSARLWIVRRSLRNRMREVDNVQRSVKWLYAYCSTSESVDIREMG
jgi:hypothetical protein